MPATTFMTEDFLLETEWARTLFHEYARHLPIIDYHCHLPPQEVATDKRWNSVTEIWLAGDHYKWRAMRSNGIPEAFITGDAGNWEKFEKWAETMPYLLRNPLYHWSHLELKRYFGISGKLLGPSTALGIYEACNVRLQEPAFSARGLMQQSNVVLVCTTDDPVDSLEHHVAVAADASFPVQMRPTWRPDKGMAVDSPERFNAWVDRLAAAVDQDITRFSSYVEALRKRHQFFHDCGCRLSDHGLSTVDAEDYTEDEIDAAFDTLRGGKSLSHDAQLKFRSCMLYEFGIMDAEKNWTQQLHYGVLRNNNTRRHRQLGPDSGFDSIGDFEIGRGLNKWLDRLDQQGRLPRTILYNINPRDNAVIATTLGNFQDDSTPGKMQFGSGWWFLDQKDGMEAQMEALSQLGLLSRFVGMLTDSRSFLSYTRHEYFRRILCNMLGNDIERGLIPHDEALVGRMVSDICYNNAARYFGFELT